jgi:hypothetical protein
LKYHVVKIASSIGRTNWYCFTQAQATQHTTRVSDVRNEYCGACKN